MTLRALLAAEGHVMDSDDPEVAIADSAERAVALAAKLPCLILATVSEVPLAVEAMRQGVFGYLLNPFQPGEAGLMVRRAVEWHGGRSPEERSAPVPMRMEEAETRLILDTLRQCKYNKSEAARRLGIGRNTLWRKLKAIRGPKS